MQPDLRAEFAKCARTEGSAASPEDGARPQLRKVKQSLQQRASLIRQDCGTIEVGSIADSITAGEDE